MQSTATNRFSMAPSADIQRSVFMRSFGHKTTFDASYLVPFYADEALPGDTFKMHSQFVVRMLSPLGTPIFDNIKAEVFYFKVPLRLIWENFQRFMGEKPTVTYVNTHTLVPTITAPEGGWPAQSLSDYLGIPINQECVDVCSFWHRAYNLIWNEWFRSQQLQDSAIVDTDDGPDDSGDYELLKSGKFHDYFTSALPWPQAGAAIELPLGTSAPVYGDGYALQLAGYDDALPLKTFGLYQAGNYLNSSTGVINQQVGAAAPGGNIPDNSTVVGLATAAQVGTSGHSGAIADLSDATAATINQLRLAFQMQKLAERDARGGTRYIEVIRSHFQVIAPDFRLQRPEFLGSSSFPINITPVPQTAPDSGTQYKGSVNAYSVSSGSAGFSTSFVEHSVVLGLIRVRADLTYQQGLPKMFSRRTKYDFYWPALANLGEQAIYNREIYYDDADEVKNGGAFGYKEAWAEYRYKPSQISGILRSQYATPLDTWHLAQEFSECPDLNSTFIEDCAVSTIDRVIKVPSEPHFIMDSYHEYLTARPMPMYSIPGMIDHF